MKEVLVALATYGVAIWFGAPTWEAFIGAVVVLFLACILTELMRR
jgi:hypothetical protein